jgi:hypothetical protein
VPIYNIVNEGGERHATLGCTPAAVSRFVLAVAVAFTFACGAQATTLSAGPHFTDVRLCTYPNYSHLSQRCTRDEGATAALSSAFFCSYTLLSQSPETVSVDFTYNGVPFKAIKLHDPGGSPYSGSVDVNTGGGLPEPGGRYKCVVRAGSAQASAEVRSLGPTGFIVDTAVCSGATARRVRTKKDFPVCQQDESAAPIRAADGVGSVVCNAIFTHEIAHQAWITLLRDDVVIGESTFWIWAPITQAYIERPSKSHPGQLRPGNYTCRYMLSALQVVNQTFTVT